MSASDNGLLRVIGRYFVKKDETGKRFLNPLTQIILILSFFIIAFFFYVLIKPNVDLLPYKLLPKLICMSLFLAAGIGFFFYHRGKKTVDDYLLFFLIASFFIHLMYMLYTDGSWRQHDVWTGENENGHEGYAYAFYEYGSLPNHHNTPDTVYQFYHPPLNAFIQGNFMRIFQAICWNSSLTGDKATLYKSCQILSVVYTSIAGLFIVKTLKLTSLSNKHKIWACAFGCFYPDLIVESAELNNDNLSFVLQLIALYFFFRWFLEGQKMRDIVFCGLFVGLAMGAKMSAASICLGMAIGFIVEFIRSIAKKDGSLKLSKIITQYCVFLLICAPIGLWYQVYLHLALGFPYNFVFNRLNPGLFNGARDWVLINKPDDIEAYDAVNSGILYENSFVNFIVRYISPFYIPDFFASIGFVTSWEYYSIQTFAMKTSIFGEYSFPPLCAHGMAFATYLILLVLYLFTWVYLVYVLFTHKRNKIGKEGGMMLTLGGGLMFMLGYLCYKMPFGCSMDYRYIMPMTLVAAYLFGKCTELMDATKTPARKGCSITFKALAGLFFLSTLIFYCTIY